MARKTSKTAQDSLKEYSSVNQNPEQPFPELIKRSGVRHAISHALVKNRFKRLGPLTIFIGIGWIVLILALINKGFLFLSGTSILSDFFGFIFDSTLLRLVFFAFSGWAIFDLARAIGQATILQPFGRFTKHLQNVNSSGGEKFVLRGKDIHFIPLAMAFNQLINRLRHADEKNKANYKKLIQLIESQHRQLPEEERNWLQKLKADLRIH